MSRIPLSNEIFFKVDITASPYLENYLTGTLVEPLQTFLSRPGKKIRSQLVQIGFDLGASESSQAPDPHPLSEPLGELVEMIHAGSLIVDDIQDGSQTRRGGPTLHLITGMPQALNAGNWLYFLAFKRLSELGLPAGVELSLTRLFQDALFEGHVGQALDLGRPVTEFPVSEVPKISESTMLLKTGSLTLLGIGTGALASGTLSTPWMEIRHIGRELGLVLQILDDLKNFKPTAANLEDPKFLEDFRNLRPGWIWSFAAQKSENAFSELTLAAQELPSLEPLMHWMNRYRFFDESIRHVRERKALLLKKTPERAAQKIEFIIRQLENAYEQT